MRWFDVAVQILLSLGTAGIFLFSILDSTVFFFTPFAIDFLFIVLVSRNHYWMPYYVLLIARGSVIGCSLTYMVVSRAGQKTLEKHFPKRKLQKVQGQIKKRGAMAIVIAALLPPPLPFTPFIAAAAITKLTLKKLLGAVSIGRVLRFLVEGVLAILFGRQLVHLLKSDVFKVAMISLFCLALLGSAISVFQWTRKTA